MERDPIPTRKQVEEILHSRFDGVPIQEFHKFTRQLGFACTTIPLLKTTHKELAHNIKVLCNQADQSSSFKIQLCRELSLLDPEDQKEIQLRQLRQITARSATTVKDSAFRSSKWILWIVVLLLLLVAIFLGWCALVIDMIGGLIM